MLLQKLNANYFEDTRAKFDGIIAYAQCKRQMVRHKKCRINAKSANFTLLVVGLLVNISSL